MTDYQDESPKKAGVSEEDQAILNTSKKRFELCQEAEKNLREVALDDLKFRAGEQWPEAIKNQRQVEKRPCLTINVLPARERQVLNDQRQNRPAIKVSAVDDKADVDTAEVLQGIIRHIEYDSNADVAYDTAFASACRIGFGYMRLITEIEDGQQVIKIKRVTNAFQVYMDPSCEEPDYSDANFGFFITTFTRDEYVEQYPDSELASLDDWESTGNKDPEWLSKDGVRVAEYFYKKDGKVKWCLHNAVEILKKTDWLGRWIPIIPVLGDELNVDGHKMLEGIVRHAKDPMRMQNFMASAEVEAIALAPKAPYVAAYGQTEDFPEWKTANTQNHAVLRYKPVSSDGKDVGKPERNIAEPAIQAITESRMHFAEDLRDVTGIYQAQYGAKSQEVSGRAISAKKQQGEVANFHYIDNLTRALRFLGRQVLELIQKLYTAKMAIRTLGEDNTQKVVLINQMFNGRQFSIGTGKYDVILSAGPSYATKRQEAADAMIEFSKVYPKLPEVAGDIMVASMDWPNHEKVAERIKKTLPQGLADDDPSDPKVALQQMQAQLRQAGQQIELLSKANSEMLDVIKQKQVEQEGKREITEMQERTKILVAEISTKAQESQLRMKMEQDQWLALHGSAHDLGLAAQQSQQDQQAQAADQNHEAGMQASDQAQESGMADKQAAIASQQADQGHAQTLEQQQQAADLAPEPASK